jgi:hypothetical protein
MRLHAEELRDAQRAAVLVLGTWIEAVREALEAEEERLAARRLAQYSPATQMRRRIDKEIFAIRQEEARVSIRLESERLERLARERLGKPLDD